MKMNVLLTGATGYIGRRLQERLFADHSVRLRLFVRNVRKVPAAPDDRVELFEGNVLSPESIHKGLEGIDVAYYLIHSMGAGSDFEELDRTSARNFLEAAIQNKVKRIIYLGGLGKKDTSSKHLRSRLETGEILCSRPDRIQSVWLRAGVIIGSGSASFEIVRHLVQKLPVMLTPRWVRTQTQPIGVQDVLDYLFQAKDVPVEGSVTVDIGAEKMSFKAMLQGAARVMGLKRTILPVSVLSPGLSSHWLKLMTPVPFAVAGALIQGLKSETTAQNDNALLYFPGIHPRSYEESFRMALAEIQNRQVISRWCDSSAQGVCDMGGRDRPESGVYREAISVDFGQLPAEAVFSAVESIGGDSGWFTYDWLWRLRGFIDILFGGPGLSRGRRDPGRLRVGDGLDFLKVVDLKPNQRLLLVNQMKVPGKAWLEFLIEGSRLTVAAHFYPKGVWGRTYWLLTKPAHKLVFPDIAAGIIRKAGQRETGKLDPMDRKPD
jgi:uncharacterized protein YbjT (DUF2867 family)